MNTIITMIKCMVCFLNPEHIFDVNTLGRIPIVTILDLVRISGICLQ